MLSNDKPFRYHFGIYMYLCIYVSIYLSIYLFISVIIHVWGEVCPEMVEANCREFARFDRQAECIYVSICLPVCIYCISTVPKVA